MLSFVRSLLFYVEFLTRTVVLLNIYHHQQNPVSVFFVLRLAETSVIIDMVTDCETESPNTIIANFTREIINYGAWYL